MNVAIMEDFHASPLSSQYPAEFLSKLAVETPVHRRRGSGAMKMMRTSSISKMFPSKNSSKGFGSSWGEKSFGSIKGHDSFNLRGNDSYTFKGNESATDITLSSSLSSLEEDEFAGLNLIKDVDIAIIDLNKRAIKAEIKINNVLELAQARYEGGSELGALISMRKVHRNRNKVDRIATARYELVEMRKQVEADMNQGYFDFDVPVLRNRARDIMIKIHVSTDCPSPLDNELLRQLYEMMGMVEI